MDSLYTSWRYLKSGSKRPGDRLFKVSKPAHLGACLPSAIGGDHFPAESVDIQQRQIIRKQQKQIRRLGILSVAKRVCLLAVVTDKTRLQVSRSP